MSGYIGTQPVPQATQTRDSFTCTAGQTSFATSGYTPNFLDVYLNGVKLTATDYTASNGSDVVLASGAALDDILEVVAYTSFEVVTDTVTNAGTVLNLDRTGSDGTILDLKKDGTTVGSIGAGGGRLYIGSADTGVYFDEGVDSIFPYNPTTQQTRDNAIDLGYSSIRYKDLYLSGGVYLGGTGSANKLDDYEEGTWTPVIRFGGNSVGVSYSVRNGRYTKIGRIVTYYFDISLSARGTSTGNLDFVGFPFVPTNTANPPSILTGSLSSTNDVQGYLTSSGLFLENRNTGTQSNLTHNNVNSNSTFYIVGVYETS